DGPEMASSTPTTTRGHCHHCIDISPLKTAARAAPSAPTARPMAAKIPANLAMSMVLEAALASGAAVALVPTWAAALLLGASTRLAANFWIWSDTSLETRR